MNPSSPDSPSPKPPLTEDLIRETLRLVNDPEIDCNIVDLGMLYGIRIEGSKVFIRMTLTTRGCPMHESIVWGVENALMQVDGVESAQVEIVWDPPWHPSMMSAFARDRLGMNDSHSE